MERPLRFYGLAAILLLAVAPYFVRLGASSLWDSNEAFYAETPRVMIETGDYVNPSFNDQPRFNKPPLSYWVVAFFYKLLGASESAERLAIAFGAVLMICIAYGLGRAVYSDEAGLFAAIGLAIAPRFLMFSRRIMIDVYLAMFMSAALLFFILAEMRPGRRRTYLALMYASVGLGVMTKGPVALALPALVFIIYLTINRKSVMLREMMLPAGALIIAAIVLPWYGAIYGEHGWQYIKTFILEDNLSRYTQPVWGPRRGPLFYLPVLVGDMFPWSLLFITAAGFAVKNILANQRLAFNSLRRGLNKNARSDARASDESINSHRQDQSGSKPEDKPRAIRLLATWIIVIVVFYSISSNKEDLYILPIYPAVAATVGGLLHRFISKEQARDKHFALRVTIAILGLLISLAGASVLYLFNRAGDVYRLEGAQAIGALALGGGLITIVAQVMRKDFEAIAATAGTMIAINMIFVAWTLPDFEKYKPIRALASTIEAVASADASAGYYRFASPSLRYYLRRHIFEYYKAEELQSLLASGKEVYCVMTNQDYEAIKSALPVTTYVLASRPVFQVKLKGILDRTQLPQVVLISNKAGVIIEQ